MHLHRFFFLIFMFLLFRGLDGYTAVVSGKVTSENGEPLPHVNVYVKNSTYGVATNVNGSYFLELKPGRYILTFSMLGFEQSDHEIELAYGQRLTLHVILRESTHQLNQVEIVAKPVDKAREIMRQVRDKRKFFLEQVETYSCTTYVKTSLEKESLVTDTVAGTDSVAKSNGQENKNGLNTHFKKEKLNLIESYSQTNYKNPGKYKEIVLAYHDYVEKKAPSGGQEVSVGMEIGQPDIIPRTGLSKNPYILYTDISSCDFNFYDNIIQFPGACQKPLLSPLAATSALNYSYSYQGFFMEQGRKIHRLEVKPLFKTEALFSGMLFIEDSSWALITADLYINSAALTWCNEFHIIQNYALADSMHYVPVRREMSYTIREGKATLIGNTRVDHSAYAINKDFPAGFFNNELIRYADDAFEKDTSYWINNRPLTLQQNEMQFIRKSDSIWKYYESEEYYKKSDSSFNKLRWISILAGVGHRNRAKGTEFMIGGLMQQVNPFGIGGYRHRLPGYFNKEFKNNFLLETDGFIDYGFRNNDVKGKLGAGLTYVPKKFVRTYIRGGYFYEMINSYSSIEHIFSGSNYIRTTTFSIAQRMEIINGLFGELTIIYSDQEPITDIQMSSWSEFVFGNMNNASSFERYVKTEINLELKYRIRQKYFYKNGKKIIYGSNYPDISMVYKKGIPGIFGSEVNFDYIELGAKDEMKLARFGSSRWQVLAGTYLNKNNLRVLEYKYFRGSDHYFFSDPLQSFQLLGPTLNTPNEFLRLNYIHHFEGTLLSKVPLVNLLKTDLAVGAGTLIISDSSFSHFEMFAGLERVFRIRKQLWRLGIYAVTADNTLGNADFTWKIGIDYFDPFALRWNY